MSKTDGEYELVLGNRQLLSAFFIIVILFGVFFTMGYVVGRNSAPASAATSPPAQEAKAPPETKPVETRPVSPPQKAEPAPRAKPPARPAEKRSIASDTSAGTVAVTPGPGKMYLQVMAVGQPQAGAVVDTLKQKGLPALLAPGPSASVFRVLVGPYADTAALGKAKADLENAGFRPIVRR